MILGQEAGVSWLAQCTEAQRQKGVSSCCDGGIVERAIERNPPPTVASDWLTMVTRIE